MQNHIFFLLFLIICMASCKKDPVINTALIKAFDFDAKKTHVTHDQHFLFTGTGNQFLLTKMDTTGKVLWSNAYPRPDTFLLLQNDHILLVDKVCEPNCDSAGSGYFLLEEIDRDGLKMESYQIYPEDISLFESYAVIEAAGDELVLVGHRKYIRYEEIGKINILKVKNKEIDWTADYFFHHDTLFYCNPLPNAPQYNHHACDLFFTAGAVDPESGEIMMFLNQYHNNEYYSSRLIKTDKDGGALIDQDFRSSNTLVAPGTSLLWDHCSINILNTGSPWIIYGTGLDNQCFMFISTLDEEGNFTEIIKQPSAQSAVINKAQYQNELFLCSDYDNSVINFDLFSHSIKWVKTPKSGAVLNLIKNEDGSLVVAGRNEDSDTENLNMFLVTLRPDFTLEGKEFLLDVQN